MMDFSSDSSKADIESQELLNKNQIQEDDQHQFVGEESILGIWPRVPHANVLVIDKKLKEAFLFDSAAIRLQDLGINDPEYIVEMEKWLHSEFPEYRLQYFNRFNGIPRDWLLQYEDRCCVSWMTLLCYLMVNYPDNKLKKGTIRNYDGQRISSRSSSVIKLMNRDTFVRYLYVIYCRYVRPPTVETQRLVINADFKSKIKRVSNFKKKRMLVAREMLKSIYLQKIKLPVGYKGQHMGIFWIPDKDGIDILAPDLKKKEAIARKWVQWSKKQPKEITLESSITEALLQQSDPYSIHSINITDSCQATLLDKSEIEELTSKEPDPRISKLIKIIMGARLYLNTGTPYNNYLIYRIVDTLPSGGHRTRHLIVVFSKYILVNPAVVNTPDMTDIITQEKAFSEWIESIKKDFPSSTNDSMEEFLAFTQSPRLLNEAQYMSKLHNDMVADWLFTPTGQKKNYVSSTQLSTKKGKEGERKALKMRVVQYNLTRWMVNWFSENPEFKTNYLSREKLVRRFDSLRKVFFGKNLPYGFFDKPQRLFDPKTSIAVKYDRWEKFLGKETDMIKKQIRDVLDGDTRFFIVRITKQGLGKKPRGERSDQRQIFWKKYYQYGNKAKTAQKEKQYRRALKIIYYIMGPRWREAPSVLFVREDQEAIAKKIILKRISKWKKSGVKLEEFIGNKYSPELIETRKKELKSACQILIDWTNPSELDILNEDSFVNVLRRFRSEISVRDSDMPSTSVTECSPKDYLDISPLMTPTKKTKSISCKPKLRVGKKCLDHESCGSYYCKEGRCQCWVGEKESLNGICEPKNIPLEVENYRSQPKCHPNEYQPGELIQFYFHDSDSGKKYPTFGIVKERIYKESPVENRGYKNAQGETVYCYRKKPDGNCRTYIKEPTSDDILCHYDTEQYTCRRGEESSPTEVVSHKKTLHYKIQYRIPRTQRLSYTTVSHKEAFPGYWNPKYRSCSSKRMKGHRCQDPEQCLSGQCHANPLIGCTDTTPCKVGSELDVINGKCVSKEKKEKESHSDDKEKDDDSEYEKDGESESSETVE